MAPGRALLAVVAAAIAVWLALGARAAHDVAAAEQVASDLRRAAPGETGGARRGLARAGRWTPDRGVDIDLAKLDARDGRRDRAIARLQRVVADEPRNVVAWGWLGTISEPVDAALSARAKARVRALVPRVAAR